ncbi:unnamed protein product [Arctogadus glacialis]
MSTRSAVRPPNLWSSTAQYQQSPAEVIGRFSACRVEHPPRPTLSSTGEPCVGLTGGSFTDTRPVERTTPRASLA